MNDIEKQYDTSENKTRILIVGDRSLVRQGLIQLINQKSDLEVCGEADNANQALEAIKKQGFDLIIVDISLNSVTGIQHTEKIRLRCPTLPILIVCMDNELLYAKRAFRTKASGYEISQEATEQIITAIHYAQSLLRSSVFGFTVSVRIERSSNNGSGKLESTTFKTSAGTK